jgi:glycosyltransferase involved in cell wall biosynthesis
VVKTILAISNHAEMLGGGEHSFLDLLIHLPTEVKSVAVVPAKGGLTDRLFNYNVSTAILPIAAIRSGQPADIYRTLKSLYCLCKSEKPSLIYANGSRAALYGGMAGRALRIPMVWHCRIADSDPVLDRILVRLSSCIVANSRATASRFSNFGEKKVVVVYNGIDIERFKPKDAVPPEWGRPNSKIILVPARVSRWKGHDIALRVFERIAAGNPLAHLACAGDQDPFDKNWWWELQKHTNNSEYSNRIHWLGQIDDMHHWYNISHVLLLPSINEPFGRVVAEGLACGVPVVAFRSGGIPEIVRNGREGFLIEPGDAAGMAHAVEKILANDDMHSNFAEAGPKRALDFDLDSHVRNMVSVFDANMSR